MRRTDKFYAIRNGYCMSFVLLLLNFAAHLYHVDEWLNWARKVLCFHCLCWEILVESHISSQNLFQINSFCTSWQENVCTSFSAVFFQIAFNL